MKAKTKISVVTYGIVLLFMLFYQFISDGSQLKYENGFVTHKQKTRESLFNDILAFSWSRRKGQDGN